MRTNTVFISEMVRLFPEIKPFYDRYVKDDHEFLLPHTVMSATADFLIAEATNPASRDTLQRILAYVEEVLVHGSEEDKELIEVSFVHSFIDQDAVIDAIRPMMGPNLLKEMGDIYGIVGDLDPSGTMGMFVDELLQKVPELRPVYEQHLAENFQELLSHPFMGDVVRFIITEAEKPKSRDVLQRIVDHMEQGLAVGSDDVQNLVSASFVENLMGEEPTIKAIESLMGPNLRQEVRKICGV